MQAYFETTIQMLTIYFIFHKNKHQKNSPHVKILDKPNYVYKKSVIKKGVRFPGGVIFLGIEFVFFKNQLVSDKPLVRIIFFYRGGSDSTLNFRALWHAYTPHTLYKMEQYGKLMQHIDREPGHASAYS